MVNNLRVIFQAPSTITHAIAALSSVPEAARRKVQQAILAMAKTEAGRRLLKPVFLPQPVVADFERDYAPLKSLKLDSYVVWPEDEP